jgi:zinc protease
MRLFSEGFSMLRLMIGRLTAALALACLPVLPATAADPIPAEAKIVADPAVHYGRLSNGLRYAIMRNHAPGGALSIRLAMAVGSYDEADDELGFAHFIEHMTFRSTRQSPNGAFDNRFAALGVAMGRDQNAVTGLESTIYRVDLPTGDLAGARAVLDWMRGAADGILFTPAAVETERGVVIAELQSRNNPAAEMQRETSAFQAPGLRSSSRDVGGNEASIKRASPAALQAFYDRWYRPENGVLVIVGDAPVDALERLAEEAFGSWKARGAGGVRWQPGEQPARALEAFTKAHPALTSALSACRFAAPDGGKRTSLERLRRETLGQVWATILSTRLGHLAARPGSPLLGAGAIANRDLPDSRIACLFALPTDEKWKEALGVSQAELRRFAADGPTALEVDTAIEQLRSRLRGVLYQSGTRISPVLADQIAEAELGGRTFQHPAEAMRIFEIAVQGVTAADVKAAFEADWSGNGPFLVASAPSPPARETLLAAWRGNEEAAPLAAYADEKNFQWAYRDFGKRGKVARREAFTDPDFVRLHFKNGTILNFKQTSLQSGGAEIRVRFGHGERGLSAATRLPVTLAAGFFPMGGLGRMDFEQIASALTNTTWMFTLEIESSAFVLNSSTLSDQVDQQMRLLAAYMTDPGFRPMIDDKLPTAIDMIYRAYRSEPNAVALEALEMALYPDKLSIPPRAQLAAYRVADFERMLKPVLTRSPVEVTIVGDLGEEEAVRAVAETFGALPPRPKLAPPPGEGPFRYFPETTPAAVSAVHDGPAEKASAILLWPLYVAVPERRREEYAIGLVSAIFQTRLIQQVRGQMGKVYSPAISNVMIDRADQGHLAAIIEGTPADLDPLIAAARTIAAELAAGRISQTEVDEAREPLVAARIQAQSSNEAWAGVLSHALRNPEAMDELLRYEADLAALTLEDVRRAAATWLKREPMVARALPPARVARQPAPPAGASTP